MVQALSGLARAGEGPESYDRAVDLFASRKGYSFHWLWMCTEDVTLLELSRAARAIGRPEEAAAWLTRARASGSTETAE